MRGEKSVDFPVKVSI